MTKPENIKKELSALQRHKKSVGNLMLTEIIMLAVLIILLFTVDIKAVYAVGVVVLLYNLFVIRPNKKRYTQRITAMECLFGVGEELTDCTYEPKGYLPSDALEQACLVSPRQWNMDAVCRHSIKGSYFGSKIHISEASFALNYGAKKGDTAFISGTWIEAELPQSTGHKICCMSRDITHISDTCPDLTAFGLKPLPFIRKKTDDEALAFSAAEVPEWLEPRFLKLSANGAKVLLSLQDNRLTVMINARFYAAKHKLSDSVNQQTLSFNRLPEKAAVLDLIRIIQRNAVL